MAKKSYIGVSGNARQIKKAYLGVSGIARKVKKIYLGVAGIARQILGGVEISYLGSGANLSVARYGLGAGTINGFAVFAGGSSNSAVVDYFNNSLTVATATNLGAGRYNPASGTNTNYLIFASSKSGYSRAVDAYSSSLVKASVNYLTNNKGYLGVAGIGNYVFVAGGHYGYSTYYSDVECYDSSLTKSIATALSQGIASMGSACNDNYAVFAGGAYKSGSSTSYSSTLYYYNASASLSWTYTSYSGAHMSGGNVGDYLLIAGGYNSSNTNGWKRVDAYSTSMTRLSAPDIGENDYGMNSASLNGFALFDSRTHNQYVYDASLTMTKFANSNLSTPSIATTGKHIILAGGALSNNATNQTRIYKVE